MGEPDEKETRLGHAGGKTALYGEDLEAGAQVGKYTIESLRSRGGFATVYKARHNVLGRISAIKVLHHGLASSENVIKRFEQEAQAVNRIHHRGIVDIFEIGNLLDGRPYIIMEWLEGQNLDEELERQGPMPIERVLAIFEGLVAALTAAHRLGIVHRDLKASNVVFVPADGEDAVKLVDFGIAKILDSELGPGNDLSNSSVRVGTPWSMAPEQIRGEAVDARTDIYAMGVLLFQLITGKLPFRAQTPAEVQSMHLTAEPPVASDFAAVDADIDAIVARSLRKNPDDRFQSAEAFLLALRRAVTSESTRAAPGAAVGLGIYVQAHVDSAATGDSVFEDVERTMVELHDTAERANLSTVLETSDAILLAAILPSDAEAARVERQRLLRVALDIQRQLAARPQPHGAVRFGISVHADAVLTDDGVDGRRITAGELLRLAAWTGHDGDAVVATKAALDGVEQDFVVEPIDERRMRISPR